MTNIKNILKDIFTYAYRDSGKYTLIRCAALFIATKLVGYAPVIGSFATWILGGFFCATYFHQVESSAINEEEAPGFPDTSDFHEDILRPILQVIIVAFVSFGPAFLYEWWSDEDYSFLIDNILVGLGCCYFPMAMLAVILQGAANAVSPHVVIPAIIRSGWLYAAAVVLFYLLYQLWFVVGGALSGYFIIGTLGQALLCSYLLTTNARVLGVLYRERQEKLGWN